MTVYVTENCSILSKLVILYCISLCYNKTIITLIINYLIKNKVRSGPPSKNPETRFHSGFFVFNTNPNF